MGVIPFDFFHLGLLLVIIMVFITGIVLCVAVAGVCCFHWIDSKNTEVINNPTTNNITTNTDKPRRNQKHRRVEHWREDNLLNEQLRINEGLEMRRESPPAYEALFPIIPSYIQPHQPLWTPSTSTMGIQAIPHTDAQPSSTPLPSLEIEEEELNKAPHFVIYV